MVWKAYCVTCGKIIDAAKNGAMVEAAAKRHISDCLKQDILLPHKVMVGYDVEA